MTTRKRTHGGARKGAGRPRSKDANGNLTEQLATNVSTELEARIRRVCGDVPVSVWLRRLAIAEVERVEKKRKKRGNA